MRILEFFKKVYNRIIKNRIINYRPWGNYVTLDSGNKTHNVKKVTVKQGKRLSLQRHKYRTEHWFIVGGKAKVTLNKKDVNLKIGDSIDIKAKTIHRIKNTGNNDLIFIEVQTGNYFGEDDIERIEDDYGRCSNDKE